jgi:hypothetical protein
LKSHTGAQEDGRVFFPKKPFAMILTQTPSYVLQDISFEGEATIKDGVIMSTKRLQEPVFNANLKRNVPTPNMVEALNDT